MLNRRLFFGSAGVVIAALLVLIGRFAFADTPPADRANVPMSRQAVVLRGEETSELRLKLSSSDTPAWLLELAVDPTRVVPQTGGNTVYLSGSYTLGTSGQPLSSGVASGYLDPASSGSLTLTDGKTHASLAVTYQVARNASVSAQAQGAWPALPAPPQDSSNPPAARPQPSTHVFWYVSRSAGMASYILFFFSICLGLALKSKVLDGMFNRWQAFDLHQFTALLAMTFLGLHVFALLGDGYVKFGFRDLLVPGVATYRVAWTAIGVVAFYVAVAVTFSYYLRKRIGQRAWRSLHYMSFVLFFTILLHSIGSGTDTTAWWARALYTSTGTAVVFLCLWRFLVDGRSEAAAPVPEPERAR